MEIDKIDMVMPCLIPNDEWYKQYEKIKGNEHPGRVRDLGILKYTLRSYAKNLPWLNKLYLVFFDESQVPEWLNLDCEKLQVIFHRDFIPKEHLPCFNSELMQMYFHKIPGISENIISTSDDFIYFKTVPSNIYFRNGKTVHHPTQKIVSNYNMLTKAQFGKIEKNNYMFLNNYVNDGNMYHFWTFHLPVPLRKSFMEFMWNKFEKEFNKALANSPKRSDHNINSWIFYNFEEFYNLIEKDKIYEKYPSELYHLNDYYTETAIRNEINKNYILSLNDGDGLNIRFEEVKKSVNKILNETFPNKCEFER